MNVKQLIAFLKELPEDMEVYVGREVTNYTGYDASMEFEMKFEKLNTDHYDGNVNVSDSGNYVELGEK